MGDIFVKPGRLKGNIKAPPSKSVAHRAMICAALSEGKSIVKGIGSSDDINATKNGLLALGFDVETVKEDVYIDGGISRINSKQTANVDCNESGSTLRFLVPLAAVIGINAVFDGKGRLKKRPIALYKDLFEQRGVKVDLNNGGLPLKIEGKLEPGEYKIPGNISSQYATGLLLALPLLELDSKIVFTSELESKKYVDITVSVMESFGVRVHEEIDGYFIPKNQKYKATEFFVEGDYSQAAFWFSAGALGCDISVSNLDENTKQGDKEIENILMQFGAGFIQEKSGRKIFNIENLNGIEIDASQIPDLVPILAVVASNSEGKTIIKNASRLRLKESDRIKSTKEMLLSIGAQVSEFDDGLEIIGGKQLKGGEVDSFNDHRIVMAAAIAALFTKEGICIKSYECVSKSYPNFFEHFRMLGGKTL